MREGQIAVAFGMGEPRLRNWCVRPMSWAVAPPAGLDNVTTVGADEPVWDHT